MARFSPRRRLLPLAIGAAFATAASPLLANPTGPAVAAGSATFATNGGTLTVTNSPGAIINWQQFSIARDEVTRFIQQNAASSVLNRVIGQDPSVILGQLHSNGRVFLINPSGISFGLGSVVNVAGFVASTLNIGDADFISGRLRFAGTGLEGRITNAGEISTPAGGHVYLIAPKVANEASGVIRSPNGEVVVAAGKTVELVHAQTPDIRVEFTAPDNEAVNAGQIVASSGRIGVYGTLVRNSGLVSASRAEVGDGGRIVFRAAQDIGNAGMVQANGGEGASAGSISMIAQRDLTLEGTSRVEAKGDGANSTGGDVYLYSHGNAHAGTGQVIDISGGTISGDGGRGELSAANLVSFGGTVRGDAAPGYRKGTFLIDPIDFSFVGGVIAANTTVQAEDNITIEGNATIASGVTLTLLADHDNNGGSPTAGVWDAATGDGSTVGIGSITRTGAFTIAGDVDGTSSLVMYAGGGGIGTSTDPILTAMNGGSITVNTTNPNQLGAADTFISNTGAVNITSVTTRGNAFHLTSAGSVTSSGTITTKAAADSAINSGAVTIDATAGDVNLGGNIITAGADHSTGAGSNAGDVSVTTTDGAIVLASIDAQGGASFNPTSNGGDGGQITITAGGATTTSTTTVNGTLNASGGVPGAGGGPGAGGAILVNAASGGAGATQILDDVSTTANNITIRGASVDVGDDAPIGTTGNGILTVTAIGGAVTVGIGSELRADTGPVSVLGPAGVTLDSAVVTLGGGVTISSNAGSVSSSAGVGTTGVLVDSGAVSVHGETGVSFTANIITTGQSNGSGAGRNAGDVSVTTTDGAIVVASIDAQGGASINPTSNGGDGGQITLTAGGATTTSTTTVNGALNASGGVPGAGGGPGAGKAILVNAASGGAGATQILGAVSTTANNITIRGASVDVGDGAPIGTTGNGILTVTAIGGAVTVGTLSDLSAETGPVSVLGPAGVTLDSAVVTLGGGVTISSNAGMVSSSAGVATMGVVGDSGAVSVHGETGVNFTANIITTGQSNGSGAGRNAGDVSVTTTDGAIVVASIDAQGGASINPTSNGGDGGQITLTAGGATTTSTTTVNGALNASGGVPGAGGGPGAGKAILVNAASGGAGATQINGVVSTNEASIDIRGATLDVAAPVSTSTTGSVTLQAGGNITISSGATVSAAGVLDINFGQAGAGATLDLSGSGVLTGSTVNFTGGGGLDVIVGRNVANSWIVTGGDSGTLNGANFTSVENLTGGSGDDSFVIQDAGSLTGSVVGGLHGTADTLDLSNKVGAVSIDLQGATATGLGGTFSGIEAFTGNDGTTGTNTTLTGPNAGATFDVTGTNSGTVAGLSFSGVGNLTGGTGDDSFMIQDAGSLTGSVVGGLHGTADTLDLSNKVGAVSINLQGATATGLGGTFSGIEAFTGNDGTTGTNTTLTGPNAGATFDVTGTNSGTVAGLSFSGVGNLSGGTGDDSFVIQDAGALTGSIVGGLQGTVDILDLSNKLGAVTLNAGGGGATGLGGTFSGIETLVGNDGTTGTNTTLTGANVANAWDVTGTNAGTLNGTLNFSGVGNLTGGTGDDSFMIQDAGSLTGSIVGGLQGTTDILDLSNKVGAVSIDLQGATATGLGGTFSGIESLVGNDATTGTNTTLAGANGANAWNVTGTNAGTLNGTLSFSGVGNLTGGTGDDSFVIQDAGSLTGSVVGGLHGTADTLDLSNKVGAVSINLQGATATGLGGTFGGIESLVGNDATTGTSTTLTGPNAGATFDVTGTNSGTVAGLSFSGVGNLTGGTGNDSFVIQDAGSLTGNVVGGAQGLADTLDLSNKVGAVSINLQGATATGLGGTFSGIEAFTGNDGTTGTNTTLTGPNAGATFDVTGTNSGTVAGLSFSGVGNLSGGTGDDSFVIQDAGALTGSIVGGLQGTVDILDLSNKVGAVSISLQGAAATGLGGTFSGIESLVGNDGTTGTSTTLTGANVANAWDVTGTNAGTLNGTLSFSGVGNLTGGTGDDSFVIQDAGSLTGSVVGGVQGTADTLDLSNKVGAVSIDLQGATATGLGGTFSGIESLVGNDATMGTNTTLAGANGANAWNVAGTNAGTLNGTLSFSGVGNLTGGTGDDSFVIQDAGSLTGSVVGGLHGTADTLDLSNKVGAVSINLQGATATGLGGTFSGIEALVGNDGTTGTSTTLTGADAANTWNLAGTNAGNVNGAISFSGVGNLAGGTDSDDFLFANASLTGTVNGAAGTNTLSINSGNATVGGDVTNIGALTIATTGAANFQGDVTAGSVAVIDSAGTTFQGTLSASTIALTDTTGTVAFQGDTTVSTGLTTAANAFDIALTGSSNSIAGTTTFGNSGLLTLGDGGDAIAFLGGVVAISPASKEVNGTVSATGTGVINFGGSPVSVAGTSVLGGTSTGQITLGATTLADGVTLTLGAGAAAPISASSISGTAGGAASHLTVDTAGAVSVAGTVGTDIGTLTVVNSGGTAFQSSVTANAVTLTDTTGTIEFQGDTTINGTLAAAASGYGVRLTGAVNSIGSATFANTGTLVLGDGGDAIAFTGGVVASAPASKTVNGTVNAAGTGVIDLGGGPVSVTGSSTIGGTSTGQITLGAATLSDGVTLTLGAGAATPISASSVSGTAGGGASNLAVNTTGAVTVAGAVGTDLGTLTVTDSGGATFQSSVAANAVTLADTTGTIAFLGDFSAAVVGTSANAYNLDFTGSTTQIGSATNFLNTGRVQLGDQTADSTVLGGALAHTNAGVTRLAGTMSVSGPVNLNATGVLAGQTATINAGANAVTFNGAVDGPGALVVNSTAATTFVGAVGAGGALASLSTNASGTTVIQGGAVTTSGAQTYGDPVSFVGPTNFTSASGGISFGSTLAGNATTLTIGAGSGDLTVTGALSGVTNFTVTSGANVGVANGANAISGTASFAASGNVSYREAGGISLGASTIGGAATVVSADGGIATAGLLQANGGMTLSASDASGGNAGTIGIGAGGLQTSGGPLNLYAADDITIAGPVTTGGGSIEIIAGNSTGINYGLLNAPALRASEAGTGDNFGAVAVNGSVNAGAGTIMVVTAGDANPTASQSNVTQGTSNGSLTSGALISSDLTVITLKGPGGLGNPGADILLGNIPGTNTNAKIRFFACPSAGCPTVIPNSPPSPVPPINLSGGAEYAGGSISYTDTSGVNLAGLGTLSNFHSFTNGSFTLTANPFSAGNVTIESSQDIVIDLAQFLYKISDDPTSSLNFVAGRDIVYVNPTWSAAGRGFTIGDSNTPFNNHLSFTAARSVVLNNAIYQNNQDLAISAGASLSFSPFQPSVVGDPTGDVTLLGNYAIRTGGDVTVRGRNFSILGYGGVNPGLTTLHFGAGDGANPSGTELAAAGDVSLHNSGAILIKGGNAVNLGSAAGARLQAENVTIGADPVSPGSNAPQSLWIEAGVNNDVGVQTSNSTDPARDDNQPNAVLSARSALDITLRSDPLLGAPADAGGSSFGSDYSLVIKGGTATLSTSGVGPNTHYVTALGALQGRTLDLATDGSILIEAGNATMTGPTSQALVAASALVLVSGEKRITTNNGGSVVIRGGAAVFPATSTAAARNTQAFARLDPSRLTMTVDGVVVLEGGSSSNAALLPLNSARIDAGDEINVTVRGAPITYQYDSLQGGGLGSVSGWFFMIGGSGSGIYDANNVPLTGLVYPVTLNVPVTHVMDAARGNSVVQTGIQTFDSSLLAYIIFAANEETRAARIRKGLGEGEDLGAPACK